MKKVFIATAMAVVALLMTQCRKNQVKPVEEHIELTEFSLTANSGERSTINGLVVNWSEGDKIYVVDMDATGSGLLGYLSAENGGTTSTTFSGSIIAPTAGHRCLFYYVGLNTFTVNSSGQYTYSVANQNGLLSGNSDLDIANRFQLLKSTASVTVTADMIKNHNFGSSTVSFKGMMAISRLNIQLAGTAYSGTVKVTGGYATATLNAKTGALTPVSGTITLNNANGDYYMAVIPANQNAAGSSQTLRFATATDDRVDMTSTVAANKFYNRTTAKAVNMVWSATVTTVPVRALHAGWGGNTGTASSGGKVTGTNVDEQGVCWGTAADPTVSGSHYAHNYEYAPGLFTPKNATSNNTYPGFMSGLTPGATYHYRAYIRKGTQVKYGNDLTFTVPSTEPFPSTEVVNFGTPDLNWAKYNLGTDKSKVVDNPSSASETDWYGDNYMWGEVAAITKNPSIDVAGTWQSMRYTANAVAKYTKYAVYENNWYSMAGPVDGKTVLEPVDDCARQTLGGEWRIPTKTEWGLLLSNNTAEWIAAGNYSTNVTSFKAPVNGRLIVKGKGSSIDPSVYMFIPAAGDISGNSTEQIGNYCYYWSSSIYTDNASHGYCSYNIAMSSGGVATQDYSSRCRAMPIRPVCTVSASGTTTNFGDGGGW